MELLADVVGYRLGEWEFAAWAACAAVVVVLAAAAWVHRWISTVPVPVPPAEPPEDCLCEDHLDCSRYGGGPCPFWGDAARTEPAPLHWLGDGPSKGRS